jgi:hypothetical protein
MNAACGAKAYTFVAEFSSAVFARRWQFPADESSSRENEGHAFTQTWPLVIQTKLDNKPGFLG